MNLNADKITAQYDAARITRRTSGWQTRSSGPNSEIQFDLVTLRNRHRDLARNNPWSRRAITAIVNNTIGPGIVAQWSSPSRQKRWRNWFESTSIDADGRMNGYGLQSLIMRSIVESGECLVRRRPCYPTDNQPIPLQIQVLEADYLDHSKNETRLANGGYIVQGVEFDRTGRRDAYWLYPEHPGDPLKMCSLESVRYDAVDFLHIYRSDRPGQVRGVPWGTGAMLRLRMLDDYQDAKLERQRLAACFVTFVRDTNSLDITSAQTQYDLFTKLQPGAIEILPPGKDVSFASPPQPEDDKEFVLTILRACGADYGVPYEILTGDLSQVNFSSARMGWNEFARSIDVWRWQMLEPQLLSPLVRWYLESEAIIGKKTPTEPPLWTPPSRTMVDPARELPALKEAVLSGFISLPQAIRQQGYDPQILIQEHAAFLKELDALGIKLESDGRNSVANKTQPPQQSKNNENNSN